MACLKRNIPLSALVLFLIGCGGSTKDIHVESQLDSQANINEYKTYAWLNVDEQIHDPYGLWAASDVDLARESTWYIDREMKNRGFTMAAENPDVLVVVQLNVDMESLAVVKRGATKSSLAVANVPKGAIVVSLIDTKTNQPLWYGYAKGEVKNDPSKPNKKRLDYAITKIFKTLK